jgi:hypothetical protein
MCGASCHVLDTDIAHCGACDDPCPPLVGGVCAGGVCGCPAGQTDCGGTCVNITTSATNCGMCGNVCPPTFVCLMSACTDAPPTRYRQETPAAGSVPFINACALPGHMEVLNVVDDTQISATLPFNFRFWATDLAAGAPINVTSNGWIGMTGAASADRFPTAIPNALAPNGFIAALWGDDYTRTPGICIATTGTAPNRQFIVHWADAHYFADASAHLNFEIILSEGSNQIDIVYGTMMGMSARGVGIEDQTGSMGLNGSPCCTGTCDPTTGTNIRYVPIP